MFTRVNLSAFRDAFRSAGRKDQFSYDGLEVIFNHLEDLEDSIGEPIELDVIAICCDYAEMTPEEIMADYDIPGGEGYFDDPRKIALKYLEDRTTIVGETGDTIVFAQF